MTDFVLTGPRGDNPLGFLAALGALVALEDAKVLAGLRWDAVTPVLRVESGPTSPDELVSLLHHQLRREPSATAGVIAQARKEMEEAKRAFKKRAQEIKNRRLAKKDAQLARKAELEPLEAALTEKEQIYRQALLTGAVDPAVTLGKNLTVSNQDFLGHVKVACECTPPNRRWLDLVAAFGMPDPLRPEKRMQATPWALVSGSGRQDFLRSVADLMVQCRPEHIRQALFGPWLPNDELRSLRLDADDDRRYALRDADPSNDEPKTLWGANRLAFEALRLFPAMPGRGGMQVRGWRSNNGDWQHGCAVRWPLWSPPLSSYVVGALLSLPDLWFQSRGAGQRLSALGIHRVMESKRIRVGDGANVKYNLTPPSPVWVSVRTVLE